jgi:hypothetical protein
MNGWWKAKGDDASLPTYKQIVGEDAPEQIDSDDDDSYLEKQDRFEEAYNFRYENAADDADDVDAAAAAAAAARVSKLEKTKRSLAAQSDDDDDDDDDSDSDGGIDAIGGEDAPYRLQRRVQGQYDIGREGRDDHVYVLMCFFPLKAVPTRTRISRFIIRKCKVIMFIVYQVAI